MRPPNQRSELTLLVRPPARAGLVTFDDRTTLHSIDGVRVYSHTSHIMVPLADILYDTRTDEAIGVTHMVVPEWESSIRALCAAADPQAVMFFDRAELGEHPYYNQGWESCSHLEFRWAAQLLRLRSRRQHHRHLSRMRYRR